jgi:ABC-type sulfate/molybdate transport systems ATPase subunit
VNRWRIQALTARLDRFHLGPVDLELEGGRAVAVVGRSGAGKTTLLRAIAGFLPAEGGRVVRNGVDLTHAPPEERRIGYVPQGFGLFPFLSVAENIGYPLRLRRRSDTRPQITALLERFGLRSLANRAAGRLSGGEAQKVAIARALASEPNLLLWDEPAHALDVEARDELAHVFREIGHQDGVPLIVVTHDPTLAFSLADRFLLLGHGDVLLAGDAHALVDRPPDSFAARFAGFENVCARSDLASGSGGFASWLLSLAGPEGVAFPSPFLGPASGSGQWPASVRAVRPGPDGVEVDLDVAGLGVRARTPWRSGIAGLTVGAEVRFDLPVPEVRALGRQPPEEAGR